MAWDERRSEDRVSRNDFNDFEVNVADLSRTMDFRSLGVRDVRRVNGLHIYADVPNFHEAVEKAGSDRTKQRRLLRAASTLRRVQRDLLHENDIGTIQLQAVRLHCLNFKPYDDEAARVERGTIMAITLNSYVYDIFNRVVGDVESLGSAVGIATGTSYVANIGFRGDRELISIGSCANLAAKVIDGTDTIIVTGESYGLLPRCLKEHFVGWRTVAETRTFKAEGLRWSTHSELARELGVDYNADRLAAKTEEYRDSLPLSEMAISDASSLIDPERLSERRSKRTSAVALFADLDGFTRYVHEAEEDDDVVSLVRALHMVRHEFHAVIKQDYPGVVLQHQGDGVLAVVHMPPGDELRKRCQNAIDVAIGLQSSMDHILNKRLSGRGDIHVAVGLDVGATLITRLGKKGKREIICLGPKVSSAERLQLRSRGQEIRISQAVYDAIDRETLASQFATESSDVYVAKKLTFPRLDELEEEEAARRGRLESVVVGSRIEVETSGHRQQRPWGNAKPWCARQ